MKKDKGISFIF